MRSAIATLATLLAVSTSAFAQEWIGPAYVTRVATGDLVYAQIIGEGQSAQPQIDPLTFEEIGDPKLNPRRKESSRRSMSVIRTPLRG